MFIILFILGSPIFFSLVAHDLGKVNRQCWKSGGLKRRNILDIADDNHALKLLKKAKMLFDKSVFLKQQT